jgi:hypothetical protein
VQTPTTLAAKPHVVRFIRNHFSPSASSSVALAKEGAKGPLTSETFVKEVKIKDTLLIDCIRANLTDNPKHRLQQPPEGLELIKVLLPSRFQKQFLHQENAGNMASSLETYFWLHAERWISSIMIRKSIFKDEAIRMFYERHDINENIYPIGNFRRQLTRAKIAGFQPARPKLHRRYSYKLNNQECMQIYRLRKEEKLSYRQIANYFKMSHSTVKNIFQNISDALSKNCTNPVQPEKLLYY